MLARLSFSGGVNSLWFSCLQTDSRTTGKQIKNCLIGYAMLRALKPTASKNMAQPACFRHFQKSLWNFVFSHWPNGMQFVIWDEQLVALYVCCVCAGTRNDRKTSLGANYKVHRQQYDWKKCRRQRLTPFNRTIMLIIFLLKLIACSTNDADKFMNCSVITEKV